MAYLPPTISDFKGQFVRDFPYATPAGLPSVVRAVGTVSFAAGSITAIAVTEPGSGQPDATAKEVIVYGGGGIAGAATVAIASGIASAFTVTNPGYGYVIAPLVYVPIGGDNTKEDKVTDWDIARALVVAGGFNMMQALLSNQGAFVYAYNLLAAHYLCETILNGTMGLNGQATWLTESKKVGNVDQAFVIPERIMRSPYLAKLSTTTYGAQFLELMIPQLIGNIKSFHRATLP